MLYEFGRELASTETMLSFPQNILIRSSSDHRPEIANESCVSY